MMIMWMVIIMMMWTRIIMMWMQIKWGVCHQLLCLWGRCPLLGSSGAFCSVFDTTFTFNLGPRMGFTFTLSSNHTYEGGSLYETPTNWVFNVLLLLLRYCILGSFWQISHISDIGVMKLQGWALMCFFYIRRTSTPLLIYLIYLHYWRTIHNPYPV